MSPALVILIVLVLLLAGGGWGYRSGYMAGPYAGPGIGFLGLIIVVLLALYFLGRL